MVYQDIEKRIRECKKCGSVKPFEEFTKHKNTPYGIIWTCLECTNKRRKKWALKDKNRETQYKKNYLLNNPEKRKESMATYDKNNRDKINKRIRDRRATDINFRIRGVLRSRMEHAFNSKSSKKRFETLDLIGCSIKFLRTYLESKFADGMTWDNYGYYTWHIDHKKPCALFDLTDPEQQKKCFHYTNLQPLWAIDNIMKRDKYEE